MLFSFSDTVFRFLGGEALLIGLLWTGLAALTIALLVLMRTEWGQARPIRKCLILSLIAHVLFIGYAATVRIDGACASYPEPMVARVEVVTEAPTAPPMHHREPEKTAPWDAFARAGGMPPAPELDDSPRVETPLESNRETVSPETSPLPPSPPAVPLPMPPLPPASDLSPSASRATPAHLNEPPTQRRYFDSPPLSSPTTTVTRQRTAVKPPAPPVAAETPPANLGPVPGEETCPVQEEPAPSPGGAGEPSAPAGEGATLDRMHFGNREQVLAPSPQATLVPVQPRIGKARLDSSSRKLEEFSTTLEDVVAPRLRGARPKAVAESVPALYRLRFEENRSRGTSDRGATEETEAAVTAALAWLVSNQEADGRWSCARHGGGREDKVDGSDREMAGIKADTGITGLALLALLGAGNTHLVGPYQVVVADGLGYLVRSQAPNGNLRGDAGTYAGMYCHAMASLAIAEAYVLSGDPRLEQPLRRALNYTLVAQDPKTGGWRYYPGDPGDTSQLGWQILFLKSAEAAGIPIPRKTHEGAIRFLRSVSSGDDGGLASYRPNMRPTLTMTAEAMVCRQFLGMPPESPTASEAAKYLMTGLPEQGEMNLYYWYYATIGLHQLQDAHWRRWNASLQRVLLGSQRTEGDFAGSWDPTGTWGCYGGRVYSTAMAALCLEAYYRYQPLRELDEDGVAARQTLEGRRR